jgi:hypothetical protein
MSLGKGGKQPKAPDYVGVAREQGDQNLQAIRTGAALNRVNQTNPYGSTTYSVDPTNPDSYTQTTTLSPEQQQLLDQSQGLQYTQGQAAGSRLDQVNGQGQFSLNGLPSQTSHVNESNFSSDINAPSVGQSDVDLSGLSKIPGLDDYSGDRQRVEDAYYGRSAKRLDQQFGQRDEDARTQLLNQGLTEGSEGWNRSMQDLSNERQDAYGDARDRAIQAGGQEQSRMFADALAGRQQGVGEKFDLGTFKNQSTQQQFGNEATRTNLKNQTQSDRFAQSLTNAGLGNEARSTGLQERLTERQVPLNEFLSLYGGTPQQVQSPNVPQSGTPEAGDFQGAASSQYGAQVGAYNSQQQRNAQNLNSLIQLASIFANR